MKLIRHLASAAALAGALLSATAIDAQAQRRGVATGVAIGVGAAVLGGALIAGSGGARASECRYVDRCTPVKECWRERGARVCETTGERCRTVKVCD